MPALFFRSRATAASTPAVHNARMPSALLPATFTQPALFLLVLAGALYLFVSERLRVDVSAMLVLLALVFTGLLDAKQALSGFASEP